MFTNTSNVYSTVNSVLLFHILVDWKLHQPIIFNAYCISIYALRYLFNSLDLVLVFNAHLLVPSFVAPNMFPKLVFMSYVFSSMHTSQSITDYPMRPSGVNNNNMHVVPMSLIVYIAMLKHSCFGRVVILMKCDSDGVVHYAIHGFVCQINIYRAC